MHRRAAPSYRNAATVCCDAAVRGGAISTRRRDHSSRHGRRTGRKLAAGLPR